MSTPIATYTFLPWLRQGIAAKIKNPDTLGPGGPIERASLRVSLQVNDQPDFAANNVLLYGPGDVIGIHPQAVVRTEPRHWVTDFASNYLAHIDFYDEDFPWRFTPAAAVQADRPGHAVVDDQQTKLRPWICLIVLEESEFSEGQPLDGLLPSITISGALDAIFPPVDQAWAWAHVHISTDITNAGADTAQQTADALETLIQTNPDYALSRVICPRKLKEEAGYHAFLIPAFEAGRLAGLGQPTVGQDALAPSFGSGQTQYPIYYRWYFRTGLRGDFEYLANLLEARVVDEHVGIRDMDMQDPGFDVPGMHAGPGEFPVMGLEGALKSPSSRPRPEEWPPASPPVFLEELAHKVNLQDDLLHPPPEGQAHPDPVISPPLYGRWHAKQARLEVGKPGWVNQLNQDPRLRVPAGLGAKVIQSNQEKYMQKAWEQLGDVLAVNQKIRQFQVSITAGERIFKRFLTPLDDEQKLAVTALVHTRVLGSPTTIAQQVKESRLPSATLNPAFRRLFRPRGPLMRKALPESNMKYSNLLSGLNQEGGISAAPPKQVPNNLISLEAVGESLLPFSYPDWLRRLLAWKPLRWVLIILFLVLALVAVVITAATPAILAVGTLALLGVVEALRRRLEAAESYTRQNRTVETVRSIPPRPNFVLTEPGNRVPADIARSGEADSPQAVKFRQALIGMNGRFEAPVPVKLPGPPLDIVNVVTKLEATLNPVTAIPLRARSIIAFPKSYKYLRPSETIVPVIAHPIINEPMYRPLRDLSSELLIPNLNLIPNNTITLLQTNPAFIEAYIAGLNHEFARELLWREYPTDMRPSTFLLMWEPAEKARRDPRVAATMREEQLRDFIPLHEWVRTSALGTHENKPLPTGIEADNPNLVIAIRGDLLKRYPTAVIYAQKGKWTDDPEDLTLPRRKIRVIDEGDPENNIKEPIFKAEVLPDLRFIGFDLTVSQARGSMQPEDDSPGYFFIIQERPGEPRFGLDIQDSLPPAPTQWRELAWNHLGDPQTISRIDLTVIPTTNITEPPDSAIRWGTNAADMAYILYQTPVMVAVHAESMLE